MMFVTETNYVRSIPNASAFSPWNYVMYTYPSLSSTAHSTFTFAVSSKLRTFRLFLDYCSFECRLVFFFERNDLFERLKDSFSSYRIIRVTHEDLWDIHPVSVESLTLEPACDVVPSKRGGLTVPCTCIYMIIKIMVE